MSAKPPEAPAPTTAVAPPSEAPPRFVPTVKPPSSFISIGSQENVQLAATEVPRASATAPPQKFAAITFPSEASAAPPAAPPRSPSMEELLADVQPGIIPGPAGSSAEVSEHAKAKATDAVVEMPAPRARAASARSASGAAPGSELSATGESLGARLDTGARVRETHKRDPRQNSDVNRRLRRVAFDRRCQRLPLLASSARRAGRHRRDQASDGATCCGARRPKYGSAKIRSAAKSHARPCAPESSGPCEFIQRGLEQ